MKRTFSLAALAVLAALASLALACGGGDDEADATSTAVGSETATATAGPDASEALTIESADGLAVLTVPEGAVPEGALPEGVAASALSVTQEQGPDETAFAVYRLEPDGLVPLAPLTLTVTIEPGPDEAVVLLVTDLDGALIEDATAIVDLAPRDDGRLDVVFAVQHFSDFILGRTTRTLRIDIEPLDDQPLGATFMVRARIVRDIDGFEHELVSAGIVHRWTAAGFVGWAGAGNWRATPPLRPSEAVNPGTGSGTVTTAGFAASDSAVIVEQAFTSGSAGDFSISLSVFGITSFTREGGSGLTIFSEPPPVVWSARCVPPGTATATSTPTPTPTPTAAAEHVTAEVLVFRGERWPAGQFRTSTPDDCDGDHYHSSVTVYSLEGGTARDPGDVDPCGFGKTTEVERRTVSVTANEWDQYENNFR